MELFPGTAISTCFRRWYSCQLLSLVPAKSLWDCDAQLEEEVEGRTREAGKSEGEKVTGNSPGMGLPEEIMEFKL